MARARRGGVEVDKRRPIQSRRADADLDRSSRDRGEARGDRRSRSPGNAGSRFETRRDRLRNDRDSRRSARADRDDRRHGRADRHERRERRRAHRDRRHDDRDGKGRHGKKGKGKHKGHGKDHHHHDDHKHKHKYKHKTKNVYNYYSYPYSYGSYYYRPYRRYSYCPRPYSGIGVGYHSDYGFSVSLGYGFGIYDDYCYGYPYGYRSRGGVAAYYGTGVLDSIPAVVVIDDDDPVVVQPELVYVDPLEEGWAHLSSGRSEDALRFFSIQVRNEPGDAAAKVGYALAAADTDDADRAVWSMRRAFRVADTELGYLPFDERMVRLMELHESRYAYLANDSSGRTQRDAVFMVAALRYLLADDEGAREMVDRGRRLGDHDSSWRRLDELVRLETGG